MPQIAKHRKVKRATVLIKKTQCLKNYFRKKSYKPLCEKLKSNNNSLAKALSKEKQESQLLFSQNVALIAEVQDLGLACSKRDAVISNILKNAKEMLNMLVTMSGYLTNTISSCQEFTASSVTNSRKSCNSTGKRDSYRRLSTKSPTRGVVKPMVGGHTITKPTINLSRVNMQHISNPGNLSIIQEVRTPPRNQELNNSRSPAVVPIRQHRCENGRACRMPERLTVVSPRSSEENERRLSKRSSRHSGRISGKHSKLKSDRSSGSNSSRRNTGSFERIGSPRVKLNDVSKLLQNSQSINIRMLTEGRNEKGMIERMIGSENSNDTSQENSQTSIAIPETPPSDGSNDCRDNTVDNSNERTDDELQNTDNGQIKQASTEIQNLTSDWEDPLEGPSWLFNDSQSVPCFTSNEKKTDDISLLNDSSMCKTLKIYTTELSDDASDSEEGTQTISPALRKCRNEIYNCKKSKELNGREKCTANKGGNRSNGFLSNTPRSIVLVDKSECKTETQSMVNSENSANLANFVTQRRRYFNNEDEDEDEDDFTLMFMRQPRNVHFDINDLKLPILEESALKPVDPVEPEPEITTTLRKISEICPVPSVSNNSMDESELNQSTVKLPLLLNMNSDYYNKDLTLSQDGSKSSLTLTKKKSVKKVTVRASTEFVDSTPTFNKQMNEKKKGQATKKDLSTVKVVLQKLDEFDVKPRTPSPEETSRDLNQSLSPMFLRTANSSDSESSNTSINSVHVLNRPRRKRAPTNMQEPSLRKKLRRPQ
ncbi:uncharacterized protein LOC143181668 isoform X2 [Calliopsis andreniformis]